MNVLNRSNHSARSRGFTLVETLMVIALLVIILSFALPSVGSSTARAEMQAAAENIEYSIGAARNLARMIESQAALDIRQGQGGSQSVSISRTTATGTPDNSSAQDYLIPQGIELVSNVERFVFDPRGLVEQPGSIVLQYRDDPSLTTTITID